MSVTADRSVLAEVSRHHAAPGVPRPVDVGGKLAQLRENRQWTLQNVADLTGVAISTLSKIERNELSPTISTMQRLGQGLGLELATLLSLDAESAPSTVTGRRSINRAGRGSGHNTGTCRNVLLSSDFKNKRATPVLTTVTARSPDEYAVWAKAEAEIFVTILEGTMILHSRLYEPLELNAGDSVYYDATTEHAWTSAGPGDAVVLWVLTIL